MERDENPRPARQRPALALALLALLGIVLFSGFMALGLWQVERRAWKLALIERVDARIHAAPVAAPGPADWPKVDAASAGYRHVSLRGTFLNGKETEVYASTELGPGYWVITPLKRDDGTIVLVNRGFVPTDRKDPATRKAGEIAGETTVTGLLRISEPGGTLLRSNKPAEDRWYSRDVAAIAAKRGLTDVAPYFVDADKTAAPGGLPVGGLTQVHFRNSHLSYAITWFTLALMVLIGAGVVVRSEMQTRRAESERP
ncbi:MAG: SURF1 family protein [Pararhizobium sp.]